MNADRYKNIKRKVGTYKPMTVCIAAICQIGQGAQIVFCSDRLVTNSDGLTFEQERPKIVVLTENCLIMNAGSAMESDNIIQTAFERIKKELTGNYPSILDIAKIVGEEHKKKREECAQNDILKPRGLTYETYYSNIRLLPDWMSYAIDRQLYEYDLKVEFLIFGFDVIEQNNEQGISPHLYQISREGDYSKLDDVGFGTIGIGSMMALPAMTGEKYHTTISISEALVKVFWARKSAERVVSVGNETTDLGVLFPIGKENKVTGFTNILISEEHKAQLLELYKSHNQKMKAVTLEVNKQISDILAGKGQIQQKTT